MSDLDQIIRLYSEGDGRITQKVWCYFTDIYGGDLIVLTIEISRPRTVSMIYFPFEVNISFNAPSTLMVYVVKNIFTCNLLCVNCNDQVNQSIHSCKEQDIRVEDTKKELDRKMKFVDFRCSDIDSFKSKCDFFL